MTEGSKIKLYFPNLNGLRFIAACFVIINHVEQLKRNYHIGDCILSQFEKMIGKLGVMLFFVLSGFLITFLLLIEESDFKKIHVKKFYIRRFLRIFPLYLLLILITSFVLIHFSFWDIPYIKQPLNQSFTAILFMHLLFLPNLCVAIFGFIPYIAQAWSIGTEEQAYLIWPILLNKFKKNRIVLMIGIIFSYQIIKFTLSERFFLNIPSREIISKFWNHFNIDSIAVGGFFAVILFNKNSILKYIVNSKTFFSVLLLTVGLLLFGIRIPFVHYLLYSILFGILIINLAVNKDLKNVLEWRILNYLGQISYGIYMYHFIIMILVLKTAANYKIESNWFIYSLTLIGTIVISSISYHYFEATFLQLKSKYTRVKSGGSIYS